MYVESLRFLFISGWGASWIWKIAPSPALPVLLPLSSPSSPLQTSAPPHAHLLPASLATGALAARFSLRPSPDGVMRVAGASQPCCCRPCSGLQPPLPAAALLGLAAAAGRDAEEDAFGGDVCEPGDQLCRRGFRQRDVEGSGGGEGDTLRRNWEGERGGGLWPPLTAADGGTVPSSHCERPALRLVENCWASAAAVVAAEGADDDGLRGGALCAAVGGREWVEEAST